MFTRSVCFLKMTTLARCRLMKDFRKLQSEPTFGISALPCDDNILRWNALIFGFVEAVTLWVVL